MIKIRDLDKQTPTPSGDRSQLLIVIRRGVLHTFEAALYA
jgi:hypothetical protein